MAATLAVALVEGAPGNVIVLTGTGLMPGSGASVVLPSQGLVTPGPLTLPAVFALDGTSVTFTLPDGVMSDSIVVTANDATQATCQLVAVPQYMSAAQYLADGEGFDVSALPPGQLDLLLQDASGMIDAELGTTFRLLQVQEDHEFSESRRVWPFRGPMQRIPIFSLDALLFITSNAIKTQFNVGGSAPDVFTNKNVGYFEVQTYAVGNAILLGAIQTIGFSANVWQVTYTAGFPVALTPRAIRKATAVIVTEMLNSGLLMSIRMGPFDKVEDQFTRRKREFGIPPLALQLLRPYRFLGVR